jgi:hypothetical protein
VLLVVEVLAASGAAVTGTETVEAAGCAVEGAGTLDADGVVAAGAEMFGRTMAPQVDVPEIKQEAQDEKRDGRPDRGAHQHVAGIRAKGRLHHAAAHCRHAAVGLGALSEH